MISPTAMTYALNDDHRQIQDLIRLVARERVAPRANEIDRTAEYPHDMFSLLKELRLFTLPFPAECWSAALAQCVKPALIDLNTRAFSEGKRLAVAV